LDRKINWNKNLFDHDVAFIAAKVLFGIREMRNVISYFTFGPMDFRYEK